MNRSVRRALYRLLPARLLVPWLLLLGGRRARLLERYGFGRSIRLQRPVDERGEPLPYLPYCVIEILRERLPADAAMLEFGAGFSTLFFMKRVARLTSVEHDRRWIEQIRPRVASNVTLIEASAASAEAYASAARDHGARYDLVLVDGVHRVESFREALRLVSDRGVIVLDDSQRRQYEPVFTAAAAAGFRALRLTGHKPGELNLSQSTVFYRSPNVLGL